MTDEELIAELRDISEGPSYYLQRLGNSAADRIEALVKGYNEALNQLDSARYSVEVLEKRVAHFMARAEMDEARAERLEAALQEIATDEHPLGWIAIAALKGELK